VDSVHGAGARGCARPRAATVSARAGVPLALCAALVACAPTTRVAPESASFASPVPVARIATPLPSARSAVPRATTPGPTSPAPTSPASRGPAARPVAVDVQSRAAGDRLVTLIEQRKNKVVYVLRADSNTSTRFAEGSGESRFVNPHIVFNGERAQRLYANAPAAIVHERDRSVLMIGGVHAHTDRNVTLTSDTMRYDDAGGRLYGDGNVVIETPQGQRLLCTHVDSDVKFSDMHCTGAH